MSVRRVVLGVQNDGSIGMRVSSSGHDAFTEADDGSAITFDSSWSDLVKIHAVGVVGTTLVPSGSISSYKFSVTFPDLGYKPFAEMRRLVGNVLYDDYVSSNLPSGGYFRMVSNTLLENVGDSTIAPSDQAIYVIYKIPVPNP